MFGTSLRQGAAVAFYSYCLHAGQQHEDWDSPEPGSFVIGPRDGHETCSGVNVHTSCRIRRLFPSLGTVPCVHSYPEVEIQQYCGLCSAVLQQSVQETIAI